MQPTVSNLRHRLLSELVAYNGTPSRNEDEDSIKVEMYLRTLSTNVKHPAARLGALKHDLASNLVVRCTHNIQICRDLVCVLHSAVFEEELEQLVLWDWKKGQMLFVS